MVTGGGAEGTVLVTSQLLLITHHPSLITFPCASPSHFNDPTPKSIAHRMRKSIVSMSAAG